MWWLLPYPSSKDMTYNSTITYTGTPWNCEVCGRPKVYVGDMPYGGFPAGLEPWCTCGTTKQQSSSPTNVGWMCPVCGAGVSPYEKKCPCK